MGRSVVEVIGWVIAGSLVVLIIMNAGNAATVLQAGSNAVVAESTVLTGSGYQR